MKKILALKNYHNIVVRPHPSMKKDDPENYKKLLNMDFTYVDNNEDDSDNFNTNSTQYN